MKTKRVFWTEMAYVLGLVVLAIGTALMERADFGMSMVVAPAYVLHLKVSQFFAAYTFGMSEYVFQAVLLIALSLVLRRFQVSFLFSFVTAVLYGLVLDAVLALAAYLPCDSMVLRCVWYVLGMALCSVGVALFFRTYIPPEAYELFVKELAAKFGADIGKVKTLYDCCSCVLAIALSFAFFGFGHFEGVKLGTVVCALVNGRLIAAVDKALGSAFVFQDGLRLRRRFSA